MAGIDLELRQRLFSLRPSLTLESASDMMRDVAVCFFDTLDDAKAQGDSEWQDFTTFVCVDGVHLAAIYRREEIEFSVFEADRSFIAESEHLAMVEVDAFAALARRKARAEVVTLRFPMSEALAWMKELADEKA